MFSKFLSIEPEKQQRIINAAIKEFVKKGYDHASTNEIVKEAGISKGLLFHYFTNKKQLYLFLYDYSVELIKDKLFAKIDLLETDILIKWRAILLHKLELIKEYPDLFNFMLGAIIEDSHEINLRNKQLMEESYQKVLKDIDYTKFKEGLDVQKAINIIIWTYEGFGNQQQEKVKQGSLDTYNYDELLQEMDRYTEMLRQSFYRE